MRSKRGYPGLALLVVLLLGAPLAAVRAENGVRVTFGYRLADFTGYIPFGDAPMAHDRASGEVLVAEGREVRVFNTYGMEVFRIRTPYELATVLDLAVEPDGHVITLARDLEAPGDRPRVVATRHDFRGARTGEIEVSGAPPPFDALLPNRVFSLGKGLILANTNQMLAMAVGRDGAFRRGWDLGRILGVPDEDRDSFEITGLDVDDAGSFLVTCAVMFRAFEISPEGEITRAWGKPGSVAGTFGVVAGITRDAQGRTYVADKARRVVMVFDPQYRLLAEIGQDPAQGRPLGTPTRVLVDGESKIYVTQIGNRGVWVYDARFN